MALLNRMDWYDLARTTNWTPRYVTEEAMREQPMGKRLLSIWVTKQANQGIVFSVCDSGLGIAPEMQPKIFAALFSTKSNGLGMGLAISRSIVENHGGWLRLEPDGGTGACFRFNTPLLP